MAKKRLANTETDRDVNQFISEIKNKVRQTDSLQLLEIFNEITGLEPKIWGSSIVGYGKYTYQRKNGDEYEWFNAGFSPGSQHLSIYVMYDLEEEIELLKKLGPYKKGKACLYIKRLSAIDENVLKEIIRRSDRWKR